MGQTSDTTGRALGRAWVVGFPAAMLGLLIAGAVMPRARGSAGLMLACLGAAVVGAAWVLPPLLRRDRVALVWLPRRPHLLQMLAQGIVYGYWALHWTPTLEQIPLVLVQVPFAYLLDIGFAWRRYGNYRLGFAPFPIVGSINLFLWMTDPWFAVQFGMIALAYASREWITWRGTGRHVFNPSAIALVAVALALLLTDNTTLARGGEIAASLGRGPWCYASIFVAGLVVQSQFPIVLVTMGAALSYLALGALYFAATGVYHSIDTAIPMAVFLGMTLLITDPVTSPRGRLAKLLFGALYGASVFGLYDLLRWYGGSPYRLDVSYFDKLLFVPVLNLAAPALDRLGAALARRLRVSAAWLGRNATHVGAWAVVFLLARPALASHPGRDVRFWVAACDAAHPTGCAKLVSAYEARCVGGARHAGCDAAEAPVLRLTCAQGIDRACVGLGLLLLDGNAHVDPDAARGHALLEAACADDHADACAALAESHAARGGDLEVVDAARARACRGGVVDACAARGLALLEAGRSADAAGALRRGCDGRHPVACASLAELLLTGDGVPHDPRAARGLLRRACEAGLEPACRRLRGL